MTALVSKVAPPATFTLPNAAFPEHCLKAGYQIAHESPYLKHRGWGQIATMGNITPALLTPLFEALAGISAGHRTYA